MRSLTILSHRHTCILNRPTTYDRAACAVKRANSQRMSQQPDNLAHSHLGQPTCSRKLLGKPAVLRDGACQSDHLAVLAETLQQKTRAPKALLCRHSDIIVTSVFDDHGAPRHRRRAEAFVAPRCANHICAEFPTELEFVLQTFPECMFPAVRHKPCNAVRAVRVYGCKSMRERPRL